MDPCDLSIFEGERRKATAGPSAGARDDSHYGRGGVEFTRREFFANLL